MCEYVFGLPLGMETRGLYSSKVSHRCALETMLFFLEFSDMQKFPLRMKDNDLLVTELYHDPSNDAVTALSVYLTPKTSQSWPCTPRFWEHTRMGADSQILGGRGVTRTSSVRRSTSPSHVQFVWLEMQDRCAQ